MRLKPVRGSIIGKTSTMAANNEISLRWGGGHASGCVYGEHGPRVDVELVVSFCRFMYFSSIPTLPCTCSWSFTSSVSVS